MSKLADPAHWEKWAHDLGWSPQQATEADPDQALM